MLSEKKLSWSGLGHVMISFKMKFIIYDCIEAQRITRGFFKVNFRRSCQTMQGDGIAQ